MKAKEYVVRFNQQIVNGRKAREAQVEILLDLLKEMWALKETRRVSTDAGLLGCIREIKQKWCAIYPKLPDADEQMFEVAMHAVYPKLYTMLLAMDEIKPLKYLEQDRSQKS